MNNPPTCAWCGLPFGMLAGCGAPEAQHTDPHHGHEQNLPCRDCLAQPGEQHHPLCCVATHDDEQALCCECDLCLATTGLTPDEHKELLDQLARGER